MFTDTFNFLTWIAIIIFSLCTYLIYMYFADNMSYFKIYKNLVPFLLAPTTYLAIVFLIVLTVVINILFRIMIKEVFKPLVLLYRSVIDKKLNDEEEEKLLESVTRIRNSEDFGSSFGSWTSLKSFIRGGKKKKSTSENIPSINNINLIN